MKINKQALQKKKDNVKATIYIKKSPKYDYGESIKYVNFVSSNTDGEIVNIQPLINQEKINEDMAYAGYNLLVTSEINKKPKEIYEAYHGLWRIEESFRVMKTYLEARPVYL